MHEEFVEHPLFLCGAMAFWSPFCSSWTTRAEQKVLLPFERFSHCFTSNLVGVFHTCYTLINVGNLHNKFALRCFHQGRLWCWWKIWQVWLEWVWWLWWLQPQPRTFWQRRQNQICNEFRDRATTASNPSTPSSWFECPEGTNTTTIKGLHQLVGNWQGNKQVTLSWCIFLHIYIYI